MFTTRPRRAARLRARWSRRSRATWSSAPSSCPSSACSSCRSPRRAARRVLWRLAALAGLPLDAFDALRHAGGLARADRARHEPAGGPSTASPPTTRRRARADPRRARLAALLARARPGPPAVVGLAVQAAAARAALRGARSATPPWFPRLPERRRRRSSRTSAASSPRSGAARAEDVHWAVQHALVAQLPLDHVGRVERLGETLARLHAHVARAAAAPPGTRTESPLPLPPGAYDAAAARGARRAPRGRLRRLRLRAARRRPRRSRGLGRRRSRRSSRSCAIAIGDRERLGQLHRVAQRRVRRAQAAEDAARDGERRARSGTRARPRSPTSRARPTSTSAGAGRTARPRPGSPPCCASRDEARTLPCTRSRRCCARSSASS